MNFRVGAVMLLAAGVGPWVLRSLAASGAEVGAHALAESGGTVTYREFLRSFWGARWPELEQRLTSEQSARLETSVDRKELLAWEVVVPVVRERMRESLENRRLAWHQQFHSDKDLDIDGSTLNPSQKRLSADARTALARIIARYDPEFELLSGLTFDLTTEANEAIWDEGRVQHQPLLEIEQATAAPMKGRMVIVQKLVHFPWCISYCINSADWSALEATLGRVAELRDERSLALRDFIRSCDA